MDNKDRELEIFLEKADELINSKVILADIKIIGLLKAIAASETIVAIISTCLKDYDYRESKRRCFVGSGYNNKGEFIPPQSTKETIALVFNILMELDAKTLDLNSFIQEYFYESGSYFESYSLFIDRMIKPFKSDIKLLMDGVLDGRFRDPTKEEPEEEKGDDSAPYDNALKLIAKARENAENSNLPQEELADLVLVIDTLSDSVESGSTEAVNYAFIAYKYADKLYRKIKLFSKELKELLA